MHWLCTGYALASGLKIYEQEALRRKRQDNDADPRRWMNRSVLRRLVHCLMQLKYLSAGVYCFFGCTIRLQLLSRPSCSLLNTLDVARERGRDRQLSSRRNKGLRPKVRELLAKILSSFFALPPAVGPRYRPSVTRRCWQSRKPTTTRKREVMRWATLDDNAVMIPAALRRLGKRTTPRTLVLLILGDRGYAGLPT